MWITCEVMRCLWRFKWNVMKSEKLSTILQNYYARKILLRVYMPFLSNWNAIMIIEIKQDEAVFQIGLIHLLQ